MNTIENTIKSVFSIFIILMFVSCEEDVLDNKLEGYKDIPTNLNLTYSLDNESSGYTVNFEATAEGQVFFLLKKNSDDDNPESFTENNFSVTYDQFGTYNAVLIAQSVREAASFELVDEIPE